MQRHRITFRYDGDQDDYAITMAFSKKHVEQRKEWLTSWMDECKRRKELGLSELYLYEKNTKQVNYRDFVNKELVLFSNLDNERSIPSLVDGLKPGQRKVLIFLFWLIRYRMAVSPYPLQINLNSYLQVYFTPSKLILKTLKILNLSYLERIQFYKWINAHWNEWVYYYLWICRCCLRVSNVMIRRRSKWRNLQDR